MRRNLTRGSAPDPAGGGLCASPSPDPTRAGALPLDPEDGSANAADNSPIGSNSRRRFRQPSGSGSLPVAAYKPDAGTGPAANGPGGSLAAERRRLLAVIHVAKKKACLSDADYRAVLLEVAGVESAADCGPAELRRLAGHFRSFGRPAGAGGPRPHNSTSLPAAANEASAGGVSAGKGPGPRPGAGDNFYRIIEGTPNWRQKRHIAAMWVELGYKASGLDTRAQKQFGAADYTHLSGDDLQTLGRDLAKRLARRQG